MLREITSSRLRRVSKARFVGLSAAFVGTPMLWSAGWILDSKQIYGLMPWSVFLASCYFAGSLWGLAMFRFFVDRQRGK